MGKFTMSRSNLAITALSAVALLFIGLASTRCGRNSNPPQVEVVADTAHVEHHEPKTSKKSKSKKSKKSNSKSDSKDTPNRFHLDESLNDDDQ